MKPINSSTSTTGAMPGALRPGRPASTAPPRPWTPRDSDDSSADEKHEASPGGHPAGYRQPVVAVYSHTGGDGTVQSDSSSDRGFVYDDDGSNDSNDSNDSSDMEGTDDDDDDDDDDGDDAGRAFRNRDRRERVALANEMHRREIGSRDRAVRPSSAHASTHGDHRTVRLESPRARDNLSWDEAQSITRAWLNESRQVHPAPDDRRGRTVASDEYPQYDQGYVDESGGDEAAWLEAEAMGQEVLKDLWGGRRL
jgi:hypothetical protein